MTSLLIRRARTADAEDIARVCAAGWRDTYRGVKEPDRIEAVVAEYHARIRREIAAPEGWDGWIVAVEDESVIGAGGGGRTHPAVGESSCFTSTRRAEARGSARSSSRRSRSSSGRRARASNGSASSLKTGKGFPSTSPVASKYTASGPNGAARPKKGMFLSASCDHSRLSSRPNALPGLAGRFRRRGRQLGRGPGAKKLVGDVRDVRRHCCRADNEGGR
jgi:hypothetical protein